MMKEMTYRSRQDRDTRGIEILLKENYRGYTFYILNLQTHPTAYIVLNDTSQYFRRPYDECGNIDCHGGITYSEDNLLWDGNIAPSSPDTWVIGWDYAHSGDQYGEEQHILPYVRGYCPNYKKWTTKEIREECLDVIEQLIREQ